MTYQPDLAATKAAEDGYSFCLSDAVARLDDGRSEAAAVAASVASTCYPQYLQVQIADGDAAREQWLRAHASPGIIIMEKQDRAQQTWLATQAVLGHRQQASVAPTKF
jgi:hypothetical protein